MRSLALRSLPIALAVGVLVAACGPTGSATPSPGATPLSSAGGACPVTADPGEIAGWGVPSDAPSVIPVLATMRVTCGPNRIVIGLLGPDNRPIAEPERTLAATFFDLSADPEAPVSESDGQFAWAIEDVAGVYILNASFGHAGVWGMEIVTAANRETDTVRLRFVVAQSSPTVRVGDPAPASDTPTAQDVGGDLARISTDEDPEPAFYESSVADALGAREPFVLAFATPKFCKTAVCGPTLDRLKPIAEAWPSVTFINVEPYRLEFADGELQPVLDQNGALQPVPAVDEWGLLAEPMIFVVDAGGTVRGAFEGVFGEEELDAALDEVADRPS